MSRNAAAKLERAVRRAEEARDAWSVANSKRTELKTEGAGLETKLERDYGPDDVFLPLEGRCISAHVEKYEYEVCLFGGAAQKDGGSSTRCAAWRGQRDFAAPNSRRRGAAARIEPASC